MNETKWLGFDGDDMLDFAADRLKPRQWVLVSAAYVRRLWDLLPEGPLRHAIDAAERAEQPLSEPQRTEWLGRIDAAVPDAVAVAELERREMVKSCDPDSADQENPVLSRPNQIAPAFPLFQAASRHARNSILGYGEAIAQSAHAVRGLFAEPNELMLSLVRTRVEQASETRTQSAQSMANALRLKQEGDELADRAASAKNKRLEESKAIEIVRRIEEGPRNRGDDDLDAEIKRERAASKQLARVLREVVGNPFKSPRFETAWRTSTVVEVARGIFEARAFDRMSILADALLDADCDEETLLRHCRGTEKDVKEQPTHIRGCWVLELILGRWEPLPPAPPGAKPRRRPWDDLDIGLPADDDDYRNT